MWSFYTFLTFQNAIRYAFLFHYYVSLYHNFYKLKVRSFLLWCCSEHELTHSSYLHPKTAQCAMHNELGFRILQAVISRFHEELSILLYRYDCNTNLLLHVLLFPPGLQMYFALVLLYSVVHFTQSFRRTDNGVENSKWQNAIVNNWKCPVKVRSPSLDLLGMYIF